MPPEQFSFLAPILLNDFKNIHMLATALSILKCLSRYPIHSPNFCIEVFRIRIIFYNFARNKLLQSIVYNFFERASHFGRDSA